MFPVGNCFSGYPRGLDDCVALRGLVHHALPFFHSLASYPSRPAHPPRPVTEDALPPDQYARAQSPFSFRVHGYITYGKNGLSSLLAAHTQTNNTSISSKTQSIDPAAVFSSAVPTRWERRCSRSTPRLCTGCLRQFTRTSSRGHFLARTAGAAPEAGARRAPQEQAAQRPGATFMVRTAKRWAKNWCVHARLLRCLSAVAPP